MNFEGTNYSQNLLSLAVQNIGIISMKRKELKVKALTKVCHNQYDVDTRDRYFLKYSVV